MAALLPLALALAVMVSILLIGRRLAMIDQPAWVRVIGAASAVMTCRFWIASIAEPHLMSDHGVASIALSGALVVLAARRTPDAPPRAARPAVPVRLAGLGARGRAR